MLCEWGNVVLRCNMFNRFDEYKNDELYNRYENGFYVEGILDDFRKVEISNQLNKSKKGLGSLDLKPVSETNAYFRKTLNVFKFMAIEALCTLHDKIA